MTRMRLDIAVGVAIAALLCTAPPVLAQTAPSLGSAQSFAVLAGSTVTNTGSSVVTGNVGVSAGAAITGFPPGVVVSGSIHSATAEAIAAQTSVTTAYNILESQACTQTLTGDLGGRTLGPGVYCFSSSASLTGALTLDGGGNPNAVFIFKIGSTLTTASGSSVLPTNSASPCNVFWQVGSSATLGSTTSFAGNILALTSITLTTSATVNGRALARNGAVTLDTNTVTAACAPAPGCPPITLNPPTLPAGTVGVAGSITLIASGGAPSYTFTVTSGTLPAGLTLSPAGVLAGTPTTVGSTTVTIRATDANGCFIERVYTIVIAPASCPVITLNPTTLPTGTVGVAVSLQITASGGTGPYTFSVLTGTLPAGLTLSPGGLLSGTPTTPGSSTVVIQATDANGCLAVVTYTITIATVVPTLPQMFVVLLGLGLGAVGYYRLRRRTA